MLSHSAVSDSFWPHGLEPARFLCPWAFPGKNTEVGCHASTIHQKKIFFLKKQLFVFEASSKVHVPDEPWFQRHNCEENRASKKYVENCPQGCPQSRTHDRTGDRTLAEEEISVDITWHKPRGFFRRPCGDRERVPRERRQAGGFRKSLGRAQDWARPGALRGVATVRKDALFIFLSVLQHLSLGSALDRADELASP